MTQYQNILVAVDGSEEAKTALIKAAKIAAEDKAQLIITHVIDMRYFARFQLYDDGSIITQAKTHGQELLEGYKEEAKQFGVEKVGTALEFGSPRSEIPGAIAKKYEADLIVVGATGLNAIERALIGSVSEAIIRHAACDILVVRNR
ncbi:universal stress protein [Pseudobacillus wudalianchiensis]|uniref:Universal stress protein n=1 Tax=Pseudobacillus wudalianchiensis TaxID=1743143 RepID=A0A1B9B735_9BACI|nr:universal stress protein [Bacillus wudalianchiensis]OCA91888.1 universal stress protein UspA [Bacillus wudalianchiensis]